MGTGPLPATVPPTLAGKVPADAYQLYRAIAQYVSPDGTVIQFQAGLTAGDPSTTAAMNAVPAIRTEAGKVAPTLHATAWGVDGQAPAFYDISSISNNDLGTVIPIAILVIGVLLALVMRSLVAPLYLIASVAISYFAALGAAVLIFIKIGHSGGLTFILPFLLFIFLLALGEDYNILVMTRIREEAHKMTLKEAVAKALGVTGTTVTSAGLVLAATFAVFALVGSRGSGGSQIRDVGLGLTLGILMDTFVVRTVLVPCTVVLLGRWNWWPSKLNVDSPDAESVGASADSLGLVGGHHVPAARVEHPLGDVQPSAGREGQRELPVAVTALAGVPIRVFRVAAEGGDPRRHDVAQSRSRRGVPVPSYGRRLRLGGDVGSLREDGSFEPAHPLDRYPRRVGNLLRRLAGADPCLDLLGSQGTLHFDLVLGEPRGLAERDCP